MLGPLCTNRSRGLCTGLYWSSVVGVFVGVCFGMGAQGISVLLGKLLRLRVVSTPRASDSSRKVHTAAPKRAPADLGPMPKTARAQSIESIISSYGAPEI